MRFNIKEFSQLHLLYCCEVSFLEDWAHDYFCERALVEHYSTVLERWGDNDDVLGQAARLPFEEIQAFQEHLSQLSNDAKWEFRSAIWSFVAII